MATAQFRDAGFDLGQIEEKLVERAVKDGLNEKEARDSVQSIYKRPARSAPVGTPASSNGSSSPPASSTPPTSIPSPITNGAYKLIEACFKPGEGVAISDTSASNGDRKPGAGDILTRERWLDRLSNKTMPDLYPNEKDTLFWRINPTRGKTDADVTALRHYLVDFDYRNGIRIPKPEQYKALIESKMPLAAILDSGDKSLHGILIVDAPNRAEYDRRTQMVRDYFRSIGVPCDDNKNPSRYSRVPGFDRRLYDDDNKFLGIGRQELLAINVGGLSWKEWEKSRIAASCTINWDTGGSSVTGAEFVQKAVYPRDSIIQDLFEYGIGQTEGVAAYIVGSILPVAAAILERRVWIRMGYKKIYPNLFAMLAGAAGDRKSSTVDLYHAMADEVLPEEAFIPIGFSPETLFDEYDIDCGGRPDKIWIVDDANIILTDWEKNVNGERIAARFLTLYDCRPLTESYRRNKTKGNSQTKRIIPETSTSVIFPATFNVACFQGQSVRKGIARRFLNYVGDGHGRTIVRPKKQPWNHLVKMLMGLGKYNGEIDFDQAASVIWEKYQNQNRAMIDATDRLLDDERHRLNSAPTHVQKIALIFEFCRAASSKTHSLRMFIREDTLLLAIEHVEECMRAARFLEQIANRATIQADAEIILAKIRVDFAHDKSQKDPKSICLSRTDLTAKYASHGKRRGALSPEDLYLRIIPMLIGQNLARLIKKEGKLEIYAFKKE